MTHLVVTSNKLIGFNSHSEAFAHYETQSKPCGVYEARNDTAYGININADIHGDFNDSGCFIHLHNKLEQHNYKVGTK